MKDKEDKLLSLRREKYLLENEEDELKVQIRKIDEIMDDYYVKMKISEKEFNEDIDDLKGSRYYRKIGENILEIKRNQTRVLSSIQSISMKLNDQLAKNQREQKDWEYEYLKAKKEEGENHG